MRDFPARLLVAILYGDDDEIDRYVDDWRRHAIAHVDCRVPGDPWQPGLRVGGTGHPNAIAHAHWARCLGDWLVAQPPGGVTGDDDAHE